MYIGPWQEYRLAKIQDDAIQRIRQEWEDKIRAQLPSGDDARIRELMQPLMSKLPALLMAKKPVDESVSAPASRKARRAQGCQSQQSTRPSTASSTASSVRRSAKPAAPVTSSGNQETHESESIKAQHLLPRRTRPRQQSSKKKKSGMGSAKASALEEVERRKQMFATWKTGQQEQSSTQAHPSTTDCITRLPRIHSGVSVSRVNDPSPSESISPNEPTRLPSLVQSSGDPFSPDSCEPEVSSPREEPNLEDSLDEDEVNQLLNWTDNLLSPNELDVSLAGLDEGIDIG